MISRGLPRSEAWGAGGNYRGVAMAARSSAHEKAARVMDLTLRGGTTAAGLGRARWRGSSRTRRSSLEASGGSRARPLGLTGVPDRGDQRRGHVALVEEGIGALLERLA